MPPKPDLKVLVVGSGAREHALVHAIRSSPRCDTVLAAPGNAGISAECRCLPIPADAIDPLAEAATREGINFAVIGPEVPLALGITDALERRGITVFGPPAATARLEGSKVFCKEFLVRHRIPTATARVFDDPAAARHFLEESSLPVVVKADGLAAGKGVVVASSREEALEAVEDMMVRRVFGDAGARILVEECLVGQEASIHVLVSDGRHVILPTSQDHKRVGDGDTGPNTGGMGAYSPASWIRPELLERIEREIVEPTLAGFVRDGLRFRGVLFIGVMVTAAGPKVLEFNVRFGDPETEVILPRLKGDLLSLLHSVATGALDPAQVVVKPEPSICVVVAAKGYPGAYAKGTEIRLPVEIPAGVTLFHAGTAKGPLGELHSNGGRVLCVTATAGTLSQAATKAYAVCDALHFDGKRFRRDIGWQELRAK